MHSPAKWTAIILFLGVAAAFLVWSVFQTITERAKLNEKARIAGFADAAEMDDAAGNGIADPAKWRSEVARRAEAAKQAKARADARIAADKAAKEESNRKFQIAVKGALALREMMKNPDSFSLERVIRQTDGSLCYTYRAANSFNAIIPGQAVFSPTQTAISGSAQFPSLWSKYCRGFGEEVENVAYALTYYPRRK